MTEYKLVVHPRKWINVRSAVLVLLMLVALLPIHEADAETYWRVPTMIGYGAVGTGLGVAAIWDASIDNPSVLLVPLSSLALGGLSGFLIGKSADVSLAKGEELSSLHRNAVRLGTVLTGTAIGAIAAMIIINPPGPSSLGSDEEIYLWSCVSGATLGILTQVLLDSTLRPARALNADLGLTPEGRLVLGLKYHF